MRRLLVTAFVIAIAGLVPTASALARTRDGSCSGGPGHWLLEVWRATPTSLRVRFEVRDVDAGESWQVFLSDNGGRIYAGSRTSDDDGWVRVRTRTRDRQGRDRIEASALNADTGASCAGSVRY